MSNKKYRVICTKERFDDNIIVDITPANGAIHDMMFASRKKQNNKLEDVAGSIYLTDVTGAEPEIKFANVETLPKNCNLYFYYEKLAKKLTPLIIKVYHEMKASGKESTLDIKIQDYFATYQQNTSTENLKCEELKEYAERRMRIEKYKKETLQQRAKEDAVHKPEVMLAWKQALNRGD